LPSLFHRLHFDWATGALFVLKARPGQATRRPSVGVSVQGVVSKTLAIFISPITLWLGNRMLSPPQTQGSDQGACRAVGEAFLRQALSNVISPITL
jgi:hypothetical protein